MCYDFIYVILCTLNSSLCHCCFFLFHGMAQQLVCKQVIMYITCMLDVILVNQNWKQARTVIQFSGVAAYTHVTVQYEK